MRDPRTDPAAGDKFMYESQHGVFNVRVMAVVDGYVMARNASYMPFVVSLSEWRLKYRDIKPCVSSAT